MWAGKSGKAGQKVRLESRIYGHTRTCLDTVERGRARPRGESRWQVAAGKLLPHLHLDSLTPSLDLSLSPQCNTGQLPRSSSDNGNGPAAGTARG